MRSFVNNISIILYFLFFLFDNVRGQSPIKFLIVIENTKPSIKDLLNDALVNAEKDFGAGLTSVEATIVEVDREDVEGSLENVCNMSSGVSLILDMTWTGWDKLRRVAIQNEMIYKRAVTTIIPYVNAINDLLIEKLATDVGLIFANEEELNQTLYYLIGHSTIRLVVIDEFSEASVANIRKMRPSPSYFAIFASTDNMESLFKTALEGGLVKRNDIWHLVFTDHNYRNFKYISGDENLNITLSILTMSTNVCCRMIGEIPCSCPADYQIYPDYVKRLMGLLVETVAELIKAGISLEVKPVKCDAVNNVSLFLNTTIKAFNEKLLATMNAHNNVLDYQETPIITYRAEIELQTLREGKLETFGNWTMDNKIMVAPGKKIQAARRYFRVGTAEAVPWSWIKRDPKTEQPIKDERGNDIWEGYCIDFIAQLAEEMKFDYDLVPPADMKFGSRSAHGTWTGLVGDLARGEIDIAVAALTMTSEREEVIDFVAPYFAQSGILIGSI